MTTSPPAANAKVLIVEDHALFRAMLVQLVNQESGLTVCGEADDVGEALRLIEQELPDAAIVDLTLKTSSGLELVEDLKARNLGLPVLVLSTHSEELYAERALRAGARGFISKEQPPSEVVAALHTVLAGRIYVSERCARMLLEEPGRADEAVPPAGMDLLSEREIEVFYYLGSGLSPREMSEQLSLGVRTVESHRARIQEKLGIKNPAELYQRAAQWVVERRR